ncbi:hypothetical protein E1J38_013385 [Seonamhaeicola sediminis]|uniref:Uncharacterized protein n=1 Tax=Seonamhaeicola sediminis TaxID=2528206 RepID=A0A562YAH0_9FLAO|nr:hypothetical protein [Seonamhaeicola sediminis]TWO31510.1 hypothetical protein E1J38_013385 [Seonamhaeicola sediminis]
MQSKEITTVDSIIKAFCKLSIASLKEIDAELTYSYNNKEELIEELKQLFDGIKSKGISQLKVKDAKCKYCYPDKAAFGFHHPQTDELIIRYVIFKERDKFYRVEQCKNKPIPDREDGFPF